MRYLIAAVLGALISIVWAWYIQVITKIRPVQGMVSDVLVLVLTFAQYQLWAMYDNDWKIFAAVVLGNAPAVYFYLRYQHAKQRKDLALANRHEAKRYPPPCEDYQS